LIFTRPLPEAVLAVEQIRRSIWAESPAAWLRCPSALARRDARSGWLSICDVFRCDATFGLPQSARRDLRRDRARA